MSEYQYYEFQAVDRPLSEADRRALRAISTRARITATSFTNTYEWGDLKGDPAKFMERWFDLHLYLANWGSRRLMMRLPSRLVDRRAMQAFLGACHCAEISEAGENLILDISVQEVESAEWDDGSGWLAALAPLRADLMSGDLRGLYLLWLMAVEVEDVAADSLEPLAGIAPMTGPLEALAEFFRIDPDLVVAAAERGAGEPAMRSTDATRAAIGGMTEGAKTELLVRLAGGDAHVLPELRALVRRSVRGAPPSLRTAGELRARAEAIRAERERRTAEKQAAERRRLKAEAARTRRARLNALAARGESAWREVETEIERRSAAGYDKAAALLTDLRAVADEAGSAEEFERRLRAIRERHARKARFIDRLRTLG